MRMLSIRSILRSVVLVILLGSLPALAPAQQRMDREAALQQILQGVPLQDTGGGVGRLPSLREGGSPSGGLSPPAAARGPGAVMAGSVLGSPTWTGQTYRVQRGDTLDEILARIHGPAARSPAQRQELREAYVRLNPQAFRSGSPHLLYAGAELRIPGTGTLADASASADDRRRDRAHWIRYP